MRLTAILLSLASLFALTGCPRDKDDGSAALTSAEARDAVEESTVESQASALTSANIELTTGFTIGTAVAAAAGEIRTFVESQLPCAEVTLADATLTVRYGAKPGNCTYRGNAFTGTHTVTVARNDDDIVVDHAWTDLSNGKVKVTGSAHVTWSFDDQTRRVEHDLTWTRLADGRTGRGTGDRTQAPLAGGLAEGISIDGSRSWTGGAGRYDLAIDGVQMRWADPVPQSGSYRLATPKGRSLSLSFARVDEDTIAVTLSNGNRSFTFDVNRAGAVAEE